MKYAHLTTYVSRVHFKATLLLRARRLPNSVRVSTCAAVLSKAAQLFTESSSSTSPKVQISFNT